MVQKSTRSFCVLWSFQRWSKMSESAACFTDIVSGSFDPWQRFLHQVLAAVLMKLVLCFNDNTQDKVSSNTLQAEAHYFSIQVLDFFWLNQVMLMMTLIIQVSQSELVTVQIVEDSNECIMNCNQTLSEHSLQSTKTQKWLSQRCWVLRRFVLFYFNLCNFQSEMDVPWFRNVHSRRKPKWQRKSLSKLMTFCHSNHSWRRQWMMLST